jgi:hypothetical protein
MHEIHREKRMKSTRVLALSQSVQICEQTKAFGEHSERGRVAHRKTHPVGFLATNKHISACATSGK